MYNTIFGLLSFVKVSLLATKVPFSKSLGPTAILTGTPFSSHSANLKPGFEWFCHQISQ
jgi:hypothetical protein